VRITHDTYRQVRGVFDVSEEPTIVEGMDEPLRSDLVLRAKPCAFRLTRRRVEGVVCRMVGREAERSRLADAFEDVIADASLSQITSIGDAGIGRSSATRSICSRARCGVTRAAPRRAAQCCLTTSARLMKRAESLGPISGRLRDACRATTRRQPMFLRPS
jgi:hypothetical protein